MAPSRAFDPGEAQDAEAARQKILKASDQIDLIETNYEASKTTLDGLKANITQLQDSNTALKQQTATLQQQLAALQAAFDKSEADHAKERQVLLDEVAKLVASGKSTSSPTKTSKKKETPKADAEPTPADSETKPAKTVAPATATTDSAPAATPDKTPPSDTPPATPKTQKGYYHIVETGETLTMICSAYRQQGINVTVSQIEKANGLTEKSMLKVGQKLFIPKPGT